MTNDQITQWAMCAKMELATELFTTTLRLATTEQLKAFAALVRNAALEEAAKQCDGLDNDQNDDEYRQAAVWCATRIRGLKS